MSLAEGVQASIRYKPYATGVISSNTQAVSSSDPGPADGQILRRVSSTIKLAKDTYQSNEIRDDRQIADYRHGTKRVTGFISGELSPATYFELIEAALRGTASSAGAIALDESDLTSLAADTPTSKFTAAAGDPVVLGLRIGDYIRPSNMSNTGNHKRFMITGFGGTSNRDISVFPPPVTQTADTDFDLVTVGKSVFAPSSGFVSRKFAFEIYNSDADVSRLFTECRIGGFTLQLPASGMGTIEIPVMGRDMEVATAGSAPFFTSPAAETTTGIVAAVNGLLIVGGSIVGVVTGMNVQLNLNPSADAVVGQNFVPEIFLGRANVTGQLTAFLEDAALINDFKNESEISVLASLTASTDADADAISIFLPRIKFADADVATQGEAGQAITLPFQALKGDGTAAGEEATTIRICDTAAA